MTNPRGRERLTETHKWCSKCREWVAQSEYAASVNGIGGLQSWCKPCHRAHYREQYKDPEVRAAQNARCRANFRRKWDRQQAMKLERGCAVCGYNEDPALLQWDHLDPSTKWSFQGVYGKGTKAAAFPPGWSWERIEEELKKCQVLCRPCHFDKARGVPSHGLRRKFKETA